jgi:protein-S-isoprenylcysteine O-methyltransferase Ste14
MNAITGQSPTTSVFALLKRGTKARDFLAALPLILWTTYCVMVSAQDVIHSFEHATTFAHEVRVLIRMLAKISQFIFGLLLIALMLVRRPPIAGYRELVPQLLAILGTNLSVALIVLPVHDHGSPWLVMSSFLIFFGMGFSVFSLSWLGRSFSILPESRKLVTSGPYSMIRHPLYLGEQIAIVGVALQCTSSWAIAAIVLQFCCQIYRMNYEERVLSGSFPEYKAYMAQTDRIVPWLY